MKTKGQRQSLNIEDRRVPRDINKPIAQQGTSAPRDYSVVTSSKASKDLMRARMAVDSTQNMVPMLAMYTPKKKKKI